MQIRRILPILGLAAASAGLYSCHQKTQNKTACEYDTIVTENNYQQKTESKLPLTQDFLGMTIKYKSKDDSIKANKYLKSVLDEALPIEAEYDKGYEILVDMVYEERELTANEKTEEASAKKEQISQQEQLLDSIWNVLCTKNVHSDSINQYAVESDFSDSLYIYDWFKSAFAGK